MATQKIVGLLGQVKAEERADAENVAKRRLKIRLAELRGCRKAQATLEKQFAELLEESVFDDEEEVDDGDTA